MYHTNFMTPNGWQATYDSELPNLHTSQTSEDSPTQSLCVSPLELEGGNPSLGLHCFDGVPTPPGAYDYPRIGRPEEQYFAHHEENQQTEEMRNVEVSEVLTAVEGQENHGSEPKREGKLSRRSRACTVCSKLKIRCKPMSGVGDSGEGAPCMRCWETGQECIYPESQRGRDQTRKIALLQRQLDHMHETYRLLQESLDNQSSSRYRPTLSQLENPQ